MTEPTTDPQNPTANPDDAQPGVQGDQGFKPMTEAEQSAWKDSVRKSIVADVRKQMQDEQDERDAKAKKDAEDKAAIERGEAQKVIDEQARTLITLTTERDELAAKLAAVEERAAKRVETLKSALPEEAVEDFPSDIDALTQEAWLEERQALVSKLVPAGTTKPGNGPNPKAGEPGKPDIRENLRNAGIRYT